MNKYIRVIKNRIPAGYRLVIRINHFFLRLRVKTRGKNNRYDFKQSYISRGKLEINGNRNEVDIHNSTISGLHIFVKGSNNRVCISDGCIMNNIEIWIEDDNNEVFIGNNTIINGQTHLACIEGKKIALGENCLLSANIVMRVGDSHSILQDGMRINESKSIEIGDHVWIGNDVKILKGVHIADEVIVGTGSLVTKSVSQGCIVAGNPARVIKEGVTWDIRRIPME